MLVVNQNIGACTWSIEFTWNIITLKSTCCLYLISRHFRNWVQVCKWNGLQRWSIESINQIKNLFKEYDSNIIKYNTIVTALIKISVHLYFTFNSIPRIFQYYYSSSSEKIYNSTSNLTYRSSNTSNGGVYKLSVEYKFPVWNVKLNMHATVLRCKSSSVRNCSQFLLLQKIYSFSLCSVRNSS